MNGRISPRTDVFARVVALMTNSQRNAWAKAHYPGLNDRDVDKVKKYMPKRSTLYPKGNLPS